MEVNRDSLEEQIVIMSLWLLLMEELSQDICSQSTLYMMVHPAISIYIYIVLCTYNYIYTFIHIYINILYICDHMYSFSAIDPKVGVIPR